MIAQQKISLISNKIYKEFGGQRVSENVLERDYCIAWFLVGLSKCKIREHLIFKGGTSLRRCYFKDYRFSEDLDFTLQGDLDLKTILLGLEDVYRKTKEDSGIEFGFSREDSQTHENSFTFYLWYKGPLPDTAKPKEIKVDVTIRELLLHPPIEKSVLKTYGDYDIPENQKICVYPLEEMIFEKTMALLDPARCEPRDLYDFWYLSTHENVGINNLTENIRKKLHFKKKSIAFSSEQLKKKEKRLAVGWDKRLRHQLIELPEFESIFRAVSRSIRRALE